MPLGNEKGEETEEPEAAMLTYPKFFDVLSELFSILFERIPDLVNFGPSNVVAGIFGSWTEFPSELTKHFPNLPRPDLIWGGDDWLRFKVIHGGDGSEYKVLEEQGRKYWPRFFGTLRTIADIARGAEEPKHKTGVFWSGSKVPGKERPFWNEEEPANLGKSRLLYVNGIALTEPLADQNSMDLARMFDTRVACVYNPTRGLLADLFECGIGLIKDNDKLEALFDTPTKMVVEELERMLTDDEVEHVQLVGYSQGTIITTLAVQKLQENEKVRDLLKDKLYLAQFAFCGDPYHWDTRYNPKEVELFRNEYDFVAALGRVPDSAYNFKEFTRKNFFGHLLGEHYLPGFKAGLYVDKDGNQSNLFDRIKDKS